MCCPRTGAGATGMRCRAENSNGMPAASIAFRGHQVRRGPRQFEAHHLLGIQLARVQRCASALCGGTERGVQRSQHLARRPHLDVTDQVHLALSYAGTAASHSIAFFAASRPVVAQAWVPPSP